MYNVYTVTDQAGKPMALTLVEAGLTRRKANMLARTLRMNGTLVAVYTGNRCCSFHNRP